MKKISILGSTGSIGKSALDVVAGLGKGFRVAALSADTNWSLLAEQASRFLPEMVCIGDSRLEKVVRNAVPSSVKVVSGADGLCRAASVGGIDVTVMAISGTACIPPLFRAIRHSKRIALANKEALISAGPMVLRSARSGRAEIIPVDSEHSAIFQCLAGNRRGLSKLYLTASGGPLFNVDRKRFDSVSRKAVLSHPKWKMGRKISVDSATMMNKGLEIIEAQYLFGVDESRIEVLIHREAIIHSMVEFVDGAVLAQLGSPDMRMPIQYAITYPERLAGRVEKVDFPDTGSLTFSRPDVKKFPCLQIARDAARAGALAPAVLCAADEEAVKHYLEGSIKFTAIPDIIQKVLSRFKNVKTAASSLEGVLSSGEWAKEEVRKICSRRYRS